MQLGLFDIDTKNQSAPDFSTIWKKEEKLTQQGYDASGGSLYKVFIRQLVAML
ncbi:MAG: hypothetical protein HOD92_06220 [Deltaproteobacteria bacterium]|jgi:hypothetical protein|nr:hypothetical protein [Deltaproteobacteria bacterium]MBT4526875.1 hypothetical protein [Deltaproteobacteria bacterium]